ncbi:MAG TPA: tRNA1(Val) (adenine(37)-N6)-methyltransferase [Syntrophales bacterium]|nr:tRNA1(Val) (adenine(37)-N6)-methyltransferase [Syntrophales bacterium]HQN24975.1 tRNA1(Val) (adenine(37)-N6)-methyltransferase [Syntrophales bacterium]HQP28378.1 tRNA1(Val) (adenine(37)-N6)-methyltransferase [Syntrophales bacterium]
MGSQGVRGSGRKVTAPADIQPLLKAGETLDILLDGRLRIMQPEKGYRFSIDALLLAHFVRLKDRASVLDLGTGSGVIALLLALRWRYAQVVGIEIQPELADLARRNVQANGLDDRIEIRCGDVRQPAGAIPERACDAVVFNPPYRRLDAGRINDDPQRARSRHEILGSLQDFLRAAAFALKAKGSVSLIYPSSRASELMVRMRAARLEPKRLLPVYSHAASEGEFVLVEGIKAGGEEMKLLPPLVLYGGDGRYTASVEAIFSDLATLSDDAG